MSFEKGADGCSRPGRDREKLIRIATYNILKGGSQRVHWVKMIEDHLVDLLLVQESYTHREHMPPLMYPNTG